LQAKSLLNHYFVGAAHILAAGCALIVCFLSSGVCLEPLAPGEIERYRADGTLGNRMAFVHRLKNHRFHPALVGNTLSRLHNIAPGASRAQAAFPYQPGLAPQGAQSIFVLLIEFPGFPGRTDPVVFDRKLFGNGEPSDYPYESLRNFYYRSSYQMLDINGAVLGWYRAKFPRFIYSGPFHTLRSVRGIKGLIKEALRSFDGAVDFARFDNDGDGVIDYFCVIWTGPTTGWGSPWWGWCDAEKFFFGRDSFTIDGKRLGVFSWQPERNVREEESAFTPATIIHETGHALGLPDYYDYDPQQGPDGGVGGLDMMDAGQFDHNAFSKWMLGWLVPQVMIAGSNTITLQPSAEYPAAVALMPAQKPFDPLNEFFLVQYRAAGTGNDYRLPASGLFIWHIDARCNENGTNFRFNNSYTEHKLIRLMEADGLEEIETGDGEADAEDFYLPFAGQQFSPYSVPNSTSYSGAPTGITVANMHANNLSETGWGYLAADFSIDITE
jgi:M6 family metalloprotease-like protein